MFPSKRILEKLINTANQSECLHKVSCVITDRKNNIVSYSPNLTKSHPYQSKLASRAGLDQKIYLHSEIACICRNKNRKALYRAYIIRITKHGFGMARPCAICRIALEESGISEIVYSVNYNKFMMEII